MQNQRLIKLPPSNRKMTPMFRQQFGPREKQQQQKQHLAWWKPGSLGSCNPAATNNNRRTAGTYS